MARLGLRESPLCPGDFQFNVGSCAADLFVRALEQLGERKLDVGTDPLDLGKAILLCLFEEWRESMLVQPSRHLGETRDGRHLGWWVRWREVAEQAGLLESRFAVLWNLHREKPLVHYLPESIHHTRPVEVDACRAFMLKRVKGCAFAEHLERPRLDVTPDCLKEWVAGRYPFKLFSFGGLAISRAARIAVREGRELPVRVLLVAAEDRGRARRLKGVRHVREGLEGERHEIGRLANETRDGLRHDALFLRPRTPLNQHFQIELLAREPLKSVPADSTELLLVDVAKHALLEVCVAEFAGVVVS